METGKPAYLLSNQQLRRRLLAQEAECSNMILEADQEAALEQEMQHEIELNVEGSSSSRDWCFNQDIDDEFLAAIEETITESASIKTPSTFNSSAAVKMRMDPNKKKFCCCSDEIQKMNTKLDQLTYLIKNMSRQLTHQSPYENTEVREEVALVFPIRTIKELEDLDAACANDTFRGEVMNYLADFMSLGNGLTVAFQQTLDDDLTIHLNYEGSHKNIPFLKFKTINQIMFDAWKSPVDDVESFQNKLEMEFRKAHNRTHIKKHVTV